MTDSRLTPAQLRQNLFLNCGHEFFWGFAVAFHATYAVVPLFLHKLGAPSAVVLSVAGLFSILLALPQFFSAIMSRNIHNHKLAVILVHTLVIPPLFTLGFVFSFFAPTGPSAWIFYYCCFILYGLAIGIILPVWANFLHLVTNKDSRGAFLGTSFVFNSIGGFLGGFLLKYLLESNIPFPRNFGFGFFIMITSLTPGILLYIWFQMRPNRKPEPDRSFREYTAEIRSIITTAHGFRRYILARIFFTANFPAVSMYAVYMQEKFNFAISEAGVFTVLNVISFGLGSFTVGRLGDKLGHKTGMALAITAHLVAIGVALFAQSMIQVYIVFLALGYGMGAFLPSSMNLMYDFAEGRDTKIYMALIDTSLAPFTVLMIILASFVTSLFGTVYLFLGTGVLVLIALFLLIFWVKDPKIQHRDIPLSTQL